MKGRESGMPEEDYWESFYDADRIVNKLVREHVSSGDIVEFGCGYGTFTIPAARVTSGIVVGFDIEPDLAVLVRKKAHTLGLENVRIEIRDFLDQGTGLPSGSIEHAMLYNLLHVENPIELLKETYRILTPGGVASILHWRSDRPTPRGPSMKIRPTPEQCRAWAEAAGFGFLSEVDLSECCLHHYGLLVVRS